MIEPAKRSSFSEAVVYIRILDDDTLLVVDASTNIKYLDIETLRLQEEINIGVKHSRYFSKLIDFTEDTRYFVLISDDYKESRLYETKSKKVLTTIDRHQGEVSCVAIEPKGRYMFSCGDDGISYAVDISAKALSFTLPAHKDFVNDIAFSKDGMFAATAGYDRNIQLYNLAMMAPVGSVKIHSAPVMKAVFIGGGRLLSIDKKYNALISSIDTKKVIARLKGIHDDITAVSVGSSERFVFFGTKLGYVMVYDLENYSAISAKYIKLASAVTALTFCESTQQLIAASQNGELLFYDIFHEEELLQRLFKDKKYAQMQALISKNLILGYTDTARNFENLWEKTVQRAKLLLENLEKERVQELFRDFMSIASKKQAAQKLIGEYDEYEKFMGLIKARKLSLAYALANAHPLYKETKIYKSMESEWEKDFALARKYLVNPKLSHMVDEVLAPYRGISEKSVLIQGLTLNVQVYKRFKEAINKRSFKAVFELLKNNDFLKEYPEYRALMSYSDGLYIKAQNLLGSGDTHGALKIFRMLLDFDDFRDEAKEMIAEVEARQKFYNALKEQDNDTAYQLMDEFYGLRLTEDGKKLLSLWDMDMQKARESALAKDIEGIKGSLNKYMKIESKRADIANVFSTCHLNQLIGELEEKRDQKSLENGIKNYILYYGADKHIEDFFKSFKLAYPHTKLNTSSQKKGSIERWRPSMIINSIL